jgi:hypothetical protein
VSREDKVEMWRVVDGIKHWKDGAARVTD